LAIGRAIVALLIGGAMAALTTLPPTTTALPTIVNPGTIFPAGEAPGWRFADAAFIDGLPRAMFPDVPTLAGFDDPGFSGLLAVGGAEVLQAVPRPLTRDEAIRDTAPPLQRYDAGELGVFDAASGQSLADHSVTIGGFSAGSRTTFRFAGQVGADQND